MFQTRSSGTLCQTTSIRGFQKMEVISQEIGQGYQQIYKALSSSFELISLPKISRSFNWDLESDGLVCLLHLKASHS